MHILKKLKNVKFVNRDAFGWLFLYQMLPLPDNVQQVVKSLGYIPIKMIVLNPNFMIQKVQHLYWHKELFLFTSFQ